MARLKSRKRLPGHCMVVEDDGLLASVIEATLIDAGASSVTVCTTAAQAMAKLRNHRPDVLVLDVHLADSDDGWGLAELVASVGPNSPKIIFSTGSPEDIPPNIAKLGDVLVKPYAPEDLVALAIRPPQRGLMNILRR